MDLSLQDAFNAVIGGAGVVGGWLLKALYAEIQSLRKEDKALAREVSDLKVIVAGDYVRREDLEKLSDALFAKLDRIEGKVDRKADKP